MGRKRTAEMTHEERERDRARGRENMRRQRASMSPERREEKKRRDRENQAKKREGAQWAAEHAKRTEYYRKKLSNPDYLASQNERISKWRQQRRFDKQLDAYLASLTSEQ